tara:strand:+ start:312 stop:500 length:189 start_codon:yes stop_codon:yes gene_type:complete
MKRFFSRAKLLLLTTLLSFNLLPINAGGCSSHMDKKSDQECLINDEKCKELNSDKSLSKLDA